MTRPTGRFTRLANLEQLLRDERKILADKLRLAVEEHKIFDSSECAVKESRAEAVRQSYAEAFIYARGIIEKNRGLGLDLSAVEQMFSMLQFARYLVGDKDPRSYRHVYIFLRGGFGEGSAAILPVP